MPCFKVTALEGQPEQAPIIFKVKRPDS